MDLNALNFVNARVPKLNPEIMGNVSVVQLQKAESYVDWLFRCSAKGYPEGLKYLGGRRCTPTETFTEVTKSNSSPRTFDIARSDIYLMRYNFSYKGEALDPRHIFLPFVNVGGLRFVRDTQHVVTPVIAGRIFNIEQNNIYIPSARLRMGFWQTDVSCIVNNMVINQTSVGSYLYVIRPETNRSNKKPLLVHYLLAKYGLKETLKMYKLKTKVGGEELEQLDKKKWFIFKSIKYASGDFVSDSVSKIRIAVSIDTYYSLVCNVIAGIFYIIDNCVEATEELEDLNNPALWLRLLDFFIFKERGSEQKTKERMRSHIESMESTIDSITIDAFARAGITCSTIFELFIYMTLHFQDMCVHYDYGTMYDLQLSTVEPMLREVRNDIFNAMYTLQKTPPHILKREKINFILSHQIKRNRVLEWRGHGESEPVSVASTCMLYGPSADVITHRRATNVSSDDLIDLNDPGLLMHPSLLEIANVYACNGKDFTGRGVLNPYQTLGKGQVTQSNPKFKDHLEKLTQQLNRKNNR